MSKIDKLASDLTVAIRDNIKERTSAYDTQAEVLYVDGDTAWVHIPGGVDETPVKRTIDATKGDMVQVRVAKGRAWITGNATNPPTDDRRANEAYGYAAEAYDYTKSVEDITSGAVAYVDDLYAHNITTENLTATNGYVQHLVAEDITAEDIVADHATIDDLDVNYAHITNGVIDNAKIGYADVNNLDAHYAHISDGIIDNAKIGYADVKDLNVNYAKIDLANIEQATINDAWVNKLLVQSGLVAHEGVIYSLDAIQVNASKITAGTIDVRRLVLTVGGQKYMFDPIGHYEHTSDTSIESGKDYYTVVGSSVASPSVDDLNSYYELEEGVYHQTVDTEIKSGKTYYTLTATKVTSPSAGSLSSYYEKSQYQKLNADILEDLTITADKIVAGAITAEKITTENIIGTGGWINLRNGTFNYANATTGNYISWDGSHLSIKADEIKMGGSNNSLADMLQDLQNDIDGAIETWFYDVDPTNSNAPASSWTTDDAKNTHLRDLYFNNTNGHSWRYSIVKTEDTSIVSGKTYYVYNSSTGLYTAVNNPVAGGLGQYYEFKWVEIKDEDALKALADAAKAQGTADEKRRVFVTTPTPPYEIGDLWAEGASGDLKKCKTAKTSGQSYSASDWEKATKYTDDSNVYTKSDFSITPSSIISKVSSVETWQNNFSVGGRNLLEKTADFDGWALGSSASVNDGIATLVGSSSNWNAAIASPVFDIDLFDGVTDYTVSMEYKSSVECYVTLNAESKASVTGNRTKYGTWTAKNIPSTDGEWKKYVYPARKISVSDLTSGSGDANYGYFTWYARTDTTIYIRKIKFEKGTVATDWTPAPEDSDARMTSMETSITETAEAITLEAKRRESDTNLLLDSNASSLTKINAKAGRYWSGGTWIATSIVEITDPPEPGIDYGARFVYDGTDRSSTASALVFYATDSSTAYTALPLKPNVNYTATWWGRCTNGSTTNTSISYRNGSGTSVSNSGNKTLTSEWQRFTHTFKLTGTPSDYIRIWFYTSFTNKTAATVELCGFKLVPGDSIEEYSTVINQTADNVLIQATKNDTTNAKGGEHLITSLINVATDGIKIAANKVNIEGAAIFSSGGRLSQTALDDAYDAKGAADAVEVGGRNLVWDTEWKDVSNRWNNWGSPTIREIVTLDGKRWLHIKTTADLYQGYSQHIYKRSKSSGEITSGDVITVSFLAYAATAGQVASLGIHWNNTSDSIVSQAWYNPELTTSAEKYSVTTTVPSGVDRFNIMIGNSTNTVQEVWISELKMERGNKATDWTPAPEDVDSAIDAVSTVANAAAPKSSAVSEEQIIYKQAVSGTNSVSGTTTWVTATTESVTTGTPPNSATGLTPVWTTKRPSYQKNYPVIFVAKQKKTVDGTVTCTTPLKDDSTTIIDGGHITTGTIDASVVTVNNINASNITTGTLSADRISGESLTIGKLNTDTQNKINTSYTQSKVYIISNVGISWMKLGHLKTTNARTTIINVYTGAGFNGQSIQNSEIVIYIKAGNGNSSTKVLGVTVDRRQSYSSLVKVIATATGSGAQECDVYLYMPYHYNDGNYSVRGQYISWEHSGTAVSSEPTGNSQEVTYGPWPGDYITEITSDGITIHPQSTTNNRIGINADGMTVYKGGNLKASYGDSIVLYGGSGTYPYVDITSGYINIASDANNAAWINSGGLHIKSGGVEVATYGSSITLGSTSSYNINIGTSGFIFNNSSGTRCGRIYNSSSSFVIQSGSSNDNTCININPSGNAFEVYNPYLDANLFRINANGGFEANGDGVVAGKLRTNGITEHGSITTGNICVYSGIIYKVKGSSKRYKTDISDLTDSVFDSKKLYDLPIRQFRYRDGYFDEDTTDLRSYDLEPGLIAEEVYEVFPKGAVKSNDEIDTWSERMLIPPMLKLIQDQHKDIEELKQVISELKGAN